MQLTWIHRIREIISCVQMGPLLHSNSQHQPTCATWHRPSSSRYHAQTGTHQRHSSHACTSIWVWRISSMHMLLCGCCHCSMCGCCVFCASHHAVVPSVACSPSEYHHRTDQHTICCDHTCNNHSRYANGCAVWAVCVLLWAVCVLCAVCCVLELVGCMCRAKHGMCVVLCSPIPAPVAHC